jgi:hypothetical protein
VLAAFIIRVMMEAASTSETTANFYQTTRRYNPEDSHLISLISSNFFVTFLNVLTSGRAFMFAVLVRLTL